MPHTGSLSWSSSWWGQPHRPLTEQFPRERQFCYIRSVSKLMTQSPTLRQEKVKGQESLLSVQAVNFSESIVTGDLRGQNIQWVENYSVSLVRAYHIMSNCSTFQDIDSPFDIVTTIHYSQSCKKKIELLIYTVITMEKYLSSRQTPESSSRRKK